MDEKAKEILNRIEAEIDSLRGRLQELEARVEALRSLPETVPAAETVPEEVVEDLPAAEEVNVTVQEGPVDLSDMVELPDDAPVIQGEAPVILSEANESLPEAPEAAPVRELRKPEGSFRWQKDMPGAPVKNIRSGISLYDRALFINTLFGENFARYDETLAALNAMERFDEAVDYLVGCFPDWNWGGDAVYSFMMSIRKKLR